MSRQLFASLRSVSISTACAIAVATNVSLAQVQKTATDSTTIKYQSDSVVTNDFYISKRLTTRVAISTAVAAVALLPLDGFISARAQEFRGVGGSPGEHIASTFNWIGGPGMVIAPIGLLTVGWATHHDEMVRLGTRTAEAVVLGSSVTGILKGVTGRTRPVLGSRDADDFRFRRGFGRGESASFPSGHTTAAFAFATALTTETARLHPRLAWGVGAASYTLATGVGVARVYTHHHWASDVALGAGIGTLAGFAVDRLSHRVRSDATQGPNMLIPSQIMPSLDGVRVGWQLPVHRDF